MTAVTSDVVALQRVLSRRASLPHVRRVVRGDAETGHVAHSLSPISAVYGPASP
jgi:hypothetical protein